MGSEEIAKGSGVLEELWGRKGDAGIPLLNRKMFKKQAGAGEAGFGFLEFGDVNGRDVKTLIFETGTGTREGSGENDGTAEGKCIGGVGLGGIDLDPVVGGKRGGVKPGAISEKRVATDVGDGGLEVEAAGDGDGNDFVLVWSEGGSKLAKALGVAAFGETDIKFAADAKDVATFERAGKREVFELSKGRKGFGERSRFGAARLRAERQDDGQLVEDDGRVFDEHGIRKPGLGRKREDAGPQFFQERFIGAVLLPRFCEIDGLAIDERDFAMDNGGTDGARDGGEHGEEWSLHENFLRDSEGVYRLGTEFERGSKSYDDLEQGHRWIPGERAGFWRIVCGEREPRR